MNRVLVVDKPRGMTSHDVVARVRRVTRVKRVGHAGTLDPDATGVLVVLVGKATRLAQFFVDLPKRYRGRVVLGTTTDTQDATGDVTSTGETRGLSEQRIREVVATFEGESEQVPPMVSALKRDGTPLYVLARRGETVEREPRHITIRDLRVLSVEMPEFGFELECSRGTYVRTLAADIGEALGCGGHLGDLTRTAVGHLAIGSAVSLAAIEAAGESVETLGLSMLDSLSFMPMLVLTEREEDTISTGGAIEVEAGRLETEGEFVRMTRDGSQLVAVGRLAADDDKQEGALLVRPVRVFVEPV